MRVNRIVRPSDIYYDKRLTIDSDESCKIVWSLNCWKRIFSKEKCYTQLDLQKNMLCHVVIKVARVVPINNILYIIEIIETITNWLISPQTSCNMV